MNVYLLMSDRDVYDMVLISIIDALATELQRTNAGNRYRCDRLDVVTNKISQLSGSYQGAIPEQYANRHDRFFQYLSSDLNSLIRDIGTIKR